MVYGLEKARAMIRVAASSKKRPGETGCSGGNWGGFPQETEWQT